MEHTDRHQLTVLYDGDCAVCTCSAAILRRLDRGGRLRLLPLTSAAGMAGAPSQAELLESMHVVTHDGRWANGGAGLLSIMRRIPLLTPLALIGGLPVIRYAVDAGYEAFTRNRHRISRLLGLSRCSVR